MAHHENDGSTLYYLCTNEPARFVKCLVETAKGALAAGIKLTIQFGGPEAFPTHTYSEADLAKKIPTIFTNSILYWSRMSVKMEGGTDASKKELNDKLVAEISGQVQVHA
jgi:hypothetical protein